MPTLRTRLLVASLVACTLIGIGLWVSTPAPLSRPFQGVVEQTTSVEATPVSAPTQVPGPADTAGSTLDSADTPTADTLPRSLAGAEIDGSVELDASGQLRMTLSLRRLFDQVLSSIGERSIDEIRALLAADLDRLTTPDGKRQALAAFERYLRYLQTVDQSAATLSALPLRERLNALADLRRQQLGSEMADAFFATEEAYQRFTLDRQELAADTAMAPSERAARERELIANLPDAAREPYLAHQQTEADLADGAAIETLASDETERFRLRSERFGEEAAARLEMLDRERAAWDQRVSAYRAERARLQSASPAARDAALADYLSRNFSDAEQRRIRSLEGIGEI